jgi:hypothetical protein
MRRTPFRVLTSCVQPIWNRSRRLHAHVLISYEVTVRIPPPPTSAHRLRAILPEKPRRTSKRSREADYNASNHARRMHSRRTYLDAPTHGG